MKRIMFIGRMILTAGLVYGVYTETGIFTTVFAVLVTVSIEGASFLMGKTLEALRGE